jgi:hypothetical protein
MCGRIDREITSSDFVTGIDVESTLVTFILPSQLGAQCTAFTFDPEPEVQVRHRGLAAESDGSPRTGVTN